MKEGVEREEKECWLVGFLVGGRIMHRIPTVPRSDLIEGFDER